MKEYPCDTLMYCPYGVDGYSTSCSEQCLLGRDEDEFEVEEEAKLGGKAMIYVVDKLIDGEWYFEGQGPIEYVNRIIVYLANNNIRFRVLEVEQ